MKKKVTSLLCLARALILVLLTACGSGSTNTTTATDTAAKTETKTEEAPKTEAKTEEAAPAADSGNATEIIYWYPHGGQPDKSSLENSAVEFGKENPEVKVTYEFVGGSGAGVGLTDKLMTAISGGSPPDVVLFDRFQVGQWADQGLFEDLTDLAAGAGMTPDQFYDFAWEEASLKGKLYAVPFDTDNRLLYYNKDMFAEVGLTEPPKTIAQLDEYAEKLTIKEGNRYIRLGFIPWMGQGFIYTWGWAFGGLFQDKASGKITANDPKIVEAVNWMVTYADKYGIEDVTNFSTAAGGDIDPFSASMVAMIISGPWSVSGYKTTAPDLNYDVTYIPTPSGDNFTSWAGGWSHIVPTGAKNKEWGFKFAQFMATGKGGVNYGEETTHFMTVKSINDNLSWAKSEPIFSKFVEMFPVSHCRPPISKGQLLWDELMTAQNNAINKVDTPQNLLDKVTEKVNAELGL